MRSRASSSHSTAFVSAGSRCAPALLGEDRTQPLPLFRACKAPEPPSVGEPPPQVAVRPLFILQVVGLAVIARRMPPGSRISRHRHRAHADGPLQPVRLPPRLVVFRNVLREPCARSARPARAARALRAAPCRNRPSPYCSPRRPPARFASGVPYDLSVCVPLSLAAPLGGGASLRCYVASSRRPPRPVYRVIVGPDGPRAPLPAGVFWSPSRRAVTFRAGSEAGDLVVCGPGHAHAVRDGPGVGDAVRVGSGVGDAVRRSPGVGAAVRRGSGPGAARRVGSGAGDARRSGPGHGDTRRSGAGSGCAVRSGGGHGLAVQVTGHQGRAYRSGSGHGGAFSRSGAAIRRGAGHGDARARLGPARRRGPGAGDASAVGDEVARARFGSRSGPYGAAWRVRLHPYRARCG